MVGEPTNPVLGPSLEVGYVVVDLIVALVLLGLLVYQGIGDAQQSMFQTEEEADTLAFRMGLAWIQKTG